LCIRRCGIANDYGFIPKSFSFPFGERTPFYDNAVKTQTGLRYLRGTLETNPALPLKDTNAIYHKRTGASYPYLVGDGLDAIYQNDVAEVKAALDRASSNDEVITLYAHRILAPGETSSYGIAAANLKEIILYAHSKGLTFYRFSDAFAEAPETTSTCGGNGGGGGTGNPDSITLSYAEDKGNNTYRVGLQWTNLPNDVIHIALASQPATALASASTGGAASGKVAMNVPNVVAGTEYVAVAKSGSTTLATSNPFIILAGNPPPPPPVVVAAPTNLVATAASSALVNLSWTDNSDNETRFVLGRCSGISCSNFVEVGNVNANITTYADTSVQANTSYRYRVVAYSNTTASTSYPVASVTTPAAPPPPPPAPLAAPTNVLNTLLNGNQIKLVWNDNSSSETGFQIERCLGANCTNFTLIKSLGANVTTFTNTGLSTNQIYRYRIRAYQGTTYSDYSAVVETPTLAKPTNLRGTTVTGGKATLTWADSNSYETGFKVERCQGGSCTNFLEIASVSANVLTYADSGLQVGTRYRYRIRAFHATGASAYSTVTSLLAR